MARESYDHTKIEPALQQKWNESGMYETDLNDASRENYYLLFEFPYPSGDLHIGHWYAFALTDIYARKLRMQGKNVLFPVGFDAFGLPAENAAIKHGLDPKKWTYENMDTMRAQMKRMGTTVDWSKEIISCDPEYYKWTQWLFTKFLEHDLAERKEANVKWCPKDQTVLANEQVTDGQCERCGTEVEDKRLNQWFLKITNYADRLLKDLDGLSWPNEIKEAQRAWIGASEGAKIEFPIAAGSEELPVSVFTTRADTIFGATYLVLAPEHPLLETIITHASNPDEILKYQKETGKKTERERQEEKSKTGVELKGVTALNPATKEQIPVYIADYVLASYGTGAVMAVPAHDERDFEFAKKFSLPIQPVVEQQFIDTKNPHVEGKEVVERNGIIGIVRNPADNTYLCLKWKHEDWLTFITGGTDDDEDPVESARREIAEETGYTDLRLISVLGNTRSEFYASHKNLNRVGHTTAYLFELASTAQTSIPEEEKAKHEFVWLTEKEIRQADMRHAEFEYLWNQIQNGTSAYTGDGYLIHSGEFTGRGNREAISDIVEYVSGEKVTNYRLRDWSVGRQRYWGCPIPVVYDPEGKPHPVPLDHLPWLLPEDVDMTPGAAGAGLSPLAGSEELRTRVEKIFGAGWTPEYDTLDTFVDSSWYFLRYLAPHDEHVFTDQSLAKRWMPVDRYSGGSEHTTMHLLYARFFAKALYDMALCPVSEPFAERFNRGIILGPDGQKMSKSKGNVINPDEFVSKYGADAVRMYLAFIGPYNEPGHYPWNLDGVFSMRKFLDRVYALSKKVDDAEIPIELSRTLSETIDKVSTDADRFKFNTAISALMVCVREFEALATVPREAYNSFLILLAPFAPHLADHLYTGSATEGSVHAAFWPVADKTLLVRDSMTIIIQVAGKKRAELTVPTGTGEKQILKEALALPQVARYVETDTPSRVVYVEGRLLSIVP